MVEWEKVKIKLFSDKVNTLSCDLEKRVNEFINEDCIEICDIKVSNSDTSCVVCIIYKELGGK